ncbi:integrase arm-type DNA-binding domain-containing protein [Nitrosomonas sp.]|uniref:tyrosine-type recombinase/integrase n=1 Tax=Nitrosomonas sp. TaxID=42353 RepID=UPI00208C25EB|nr:integrase arm-type DNA-binding domain-containing protein [Nitrosomonas sp.]GJL74549.1 MAG: phage integrase [Nitrosomonas sp.]
MAINKLSVKKVEALTKAGNYGDGGGLWLQISKWQTKSWVFRFTIDGKRREMGMGSCNDISLADARVLAETFRTLVRSGIDPIEARKAEHAAKRAERLNIVTFSFCAEKYIDAYRHGWKNAKHAQQWTNTLTQYAYPSIGEMPVKNVDTALVLRILEPIWTVKTETASRLRARLENILDWATTRGYRVGDNPARWKGHLENLLPKPSKIKKIQHHAALPYSQMNVFIQALRQHESISALALEFLVLTAARTNEVIAATWDEINMSEQVWIIPASRMKANREHRVPLSNRCIEILNKPLLMRQSDFIFPGGKANKGLSNAAMDKLLQVTMGYACTVHGFRSSFRDWASEHTNYPNEICEMALAHVIKDKTEAAYRRGDMLKKRRCMMNEWQKFCDTVINVNAAIVPIRKDRLTQARTTA